MKIGFIGTGAIAEAVIVGLVKLSGWEETVLVSARNNERSARLATRFPNVQVVHQNQSIATQADVLFLSMLPKQASEVVESIEFREDQRVVSLVAGISVEQLRAMTKGATNIHRVIPMPPNEIGFGPIPVFPPSPELESLLGRIGTVIPVEDENHFSTFSASSALMAVFFELVATNARWIESQGVSPRHGAMYSTSLFQALAMFTRNLDPSQLQQISQECLTVGGLNEQILNSAKSEGWFRLMESQLDLVMQRITQ